MREDLSGGKGLIALGRAHLVGEGLITPGRRG